MKNSLLLALLLAFAANAETITGQVVGVAAVSYTHLDVYKRQDFGKIWRIKMGGRGSGRRSGYSGKPETSDALPLDIRKLARSGLLVPDHSFSWQWTAGERQVAGITIRVAAQSVQLCYQKRSTGESIDQWVQLQLSLIHI